jgi:hypothetical protein
LAIRNPALRLSASSLASAAAAPLARPQFRLRSSLVLPHQFLPSVVGTDGTVSFVVRQRRREIGIRTALGAAPSNVRRLVWRHGLTIGALGVLLGVACTCHRSPRAAVSAWREGQRSSRVLSTRRRCSRRSCPTLPPTRLALRTDPLLVLRDE